MDCSSNILTIIVYVHDYNVNCRLKSYTVVLNLEIKLLEEMPNYATSFVYRLDDIFYIGCWNVG